MYPSLGRHPVQRQGGVIRWGASHGKRTPKYFQVSPSGTLMHRRNPREDNVQRVQPDEYSHDLGIRKISRGKQMVGTQRQNGRVVPQLKSPVNQKHLPCMAKRATPNRNPYRSTRRPSTPTASDPLVQWPTAPACVTAGDSLMWWLTVAVCATASDHLIQ